MSVINEISGLKDTPFKYGENPIEHAAQNVGSFWLGYMSKLIKEGKPTMFFSDVRDKLVEAEYHRPLYRGLRLSCSIEKLYDETGDVAVNYIKDQLASGAFKNVNDRIVEMNESGQIYREHCVAAFKKQQPNDLMMKPVTA